MRDNVKLISGLFFIVSSLAVLTLFTISCDPICEGYLRVYHPIPDTTVVVGDTLLIDITNPPLFDSSEEKISYGLNGVSGLAFLKANLISNPLDNGRNTLLLVTGRSEGQSVIEINASSNCLENSTNFTITFIDLN